jgi:hypothetical protein
MEGGEVTEAGWVARGDQEGVLKLGDRFFDCSLVVTLAEVVFEEVPGGSERGGREEGGEGRRKEGGEGTGREGREEKERRREEQGGL